MYASVENTLIVNNLYKIYATNFNVILIQIVENYFCNSKNNSIYYFVPMSW
ncbi:MAG: hypothetical protein K0R82_912 [Flavipsychrobacter sp.]|jgi:hypothetical protein|nr:hypothetical protein [Flavipsychrobacter sp.]